jgi:hypothetical protein
MSKKHSKRSPNLVHVYTPHKKTEKVAKNFKKAVMIPLKIPGMSGVVGTSPLSSLTITDRHTLPSPL